MSLASLTRNRGPVAVLTAALILTSLQSSDLQFVAQAGFSILNPGETGSIEVRFQPSTAVEHHGVLTLGFDAPAETTVVVSLVGTGENP